MLMTWEQELWEAEHLRYARAMAAGRSADYCAAPAPIARDDVVLGVVLGGVLPSEAVRCELVPIEADPFVAMHFARGRVADDRLPIHDGRDWQARLDSAVVLRLD